MGDDNVLIPHEVVQLYAKHGSLIRAWREYKGFTQEDIAARMCICQPAYQQIEEKTTKLRPDTLKKIAKALDVQEEQLYL